MTGDATLYAAGFQSDRGLRRKGHRIAKFSRRVALEEIGLRERDHANAHQRLRQYPKQ